MGLFDKKDHIKTKKELRKALEKEHIFKKDIKFVEEKALKYLHDGSGMSKKEWMQKVVKPLEKNTKDRINPKEARRLEDLGK